MKKSVSSSAARSGDVEVEDSEGASLENRAAGRMRGILKGKEKVINRRFLRSFIVESVDSLFHTKQTRNIPPAHHSKFDNILGLGPTVL